MKNFVEELRWRGMIHDVMPGTEEQLNKGMSSGYIGFDPTGDSLHVGSLVQIMILLHFQQCGHKPFALVGGATGMVGDPSGKSEERNLLSEDVLQYNLECIQKQLEQFLDFGNVPNRAEVVNNYDWFKNMSFLEFIRDVGKHITVNYMMAKDSVKKRLETGISFTEFSYQLVQGYDFYWLNKHKNCIVQMGGSDQWGNIVTGTELIRRIDQGEAYAITSPLLTKSDGGKFGKTESGNVWLDKDKTSPYKFYQFWRNANDEDASKYIRIFTLKSREEIESLEEEHKKAPHLWLLQEELARDITTRVHSKEEYDLAKEASEILFGKSTADALFRIPEKSFLDVFDGVPQAVVSKSKLEAKENIVDFLSDSTGFLNSKGEARRALKENSISVNKVKVNEDFQLNVNQLINNKFIVLQRGKRNYFLVIAE